MKFLDRIKIAFGAEPKALGYGSWSAFEGSIFRSSAGIAITPERALTLSAVYRCATLIAGVVSTLPISHYRKNSDGSREKIHDSDVWNLLNFSPTSGWTAVAFWEYMLMSMLLRGDGFARIRRDGLGRFKALEPLHPSYVKVEREKGHIKYYVDQDGDKTTLDESEILHFPMPGFDGLRSPSVIYYAASQTIGTSIKTEEHAGQLFGSGAANTVALEIPGTVKPEMQQALRESWDAIYGSGSNPNKRLPLVLQGGTKASTISLTAADAQLLESRRFHVEDIARAFGVPPWMIGAMDKQTSWGSGVEQAGIGFVVYTLNPHLHRIQNELTRKLMARGPGYLEFVVEGLMQGDLKAQADYMRQALGGSQGPGWMTLNEIRGLKNLPPVPEGNTIYMPKADGASNANPQPPSGQ